MANKNYNKQVTPKGYKMGGRVKKMGGGMMKRPMYKNGSKPDFLDLDKDNIKTESMKSAAASAKGMKDAVKKLSSIGKQAKKTIKDIKKNPSKELAFDKTPRSNKVSTGISPFTIARKIIAKRAEKRKSKKDKK